MRVVDLGCGVGMTTQILAGLVGQTDEVIGIDYSTKRCSPSCRE